MIILQPGDVVSVVAPASQFRSADRDLLEGGRKLLESWGLRVRIRVDETHHFYFAGPDAVRARHLLDALADEETRAIFCTRGGYGSARLLTALAQAPAPAPRLLVGHSDITMLHLAGERLWPRLEAVHGPNLATKQLLGEEPTCKENRRSLHASLFGPTRGLENPVRPLRAGHATGQLTGGCLSLIASCLGTPFALDASGAVLFLEDTGEAPYKLDRMLTHARLAGLFDRVAGVVFGVMQGCQDPYNDLGAVIADVLKGLDVPIAIGLPSGHGPLNLSLRLRAGAELDADAGLFRMLAGA